MIRVVNKYKHVYYPDNIDIPIYRGTPLGNPYTHLPKRMTLAQYEVRTREEAIAQYALWLPMKLQDNRSAQSREFARIVKLAQSRDVNLICYCAPNPCHGHIIKKLVENLIGNEDICIT